MATSGKAPDVVKNPRDPAADRSLRPQVFSPNAGVELTLEMTPMARCVATAVDEDTMTAGEREPLVNLREGNDEELTEGIDYDNILQAMIDTDVRREIERMDLPIQTEMQFGSA